MPAEFAYMQASYTWAYKKLKKDLNYGHKSIKQLFSYAII